MHRGKRAVEFTSTDNPKLRDLRAWHEVEVHCLRCQHKAILYPATLRARFDGKNALADVLTRARCSQCGALGRLRWNVYRMPRD